MLDMELPGLARSLSGPLSPCEALLKDLSLDAVQLCQRDGEALPSQPPPPPPPSLPPSFALVVCWKQALERARDETVQVRARSGRACVRRDVLLQPRRASAPRG